MSDNQNTTGREIGQRDLEYILPPDERAFGEMPYHSRLFLALSAQSCRYTIYHFLSTDDWTATIDKLVEGIGTIAAHVDDRAIEISDRELHSLLTETEIPQLARLDAFEYDKRTQIVRYHRQPTLEEYAEHAAIQELSEEFVHERLFAPSD